METSLNIPNAFAILIEDEQSVRKATTQTLELGGFEVTACDSAEAVRALVKG